MHVIYIQFWQPVKNELNGLNTTVSFAKELKKEISGIIIIRREKKALSEQIIEKIQKDYKDKVLKKY